MPPLAKICVALRHNVSRESGDGGLLGERGHSVGVGRGGSDGSEKGGEKTEELSSEPPSRGFTFFLLSYNAKIFTNGVNSDGGEEVEIMKAVLHVGALGMYYVNSVMDRFSFTAIRAPFLKGFAESPMVVRIRTTGGMFLMFYQILPVTQ